MSELRIGCCGFPGGMARYWQGFRVVEVQKTFYRPPRLATAERWRREAPPEAEFALKAWQLITHEPSSPTYRRAGPDFDPERSDRYGSFRDTEEVWEAWLTTRAMAQALQAKVILFQCPARFTPTEEHLRSLSGFFSRIRPAGFRFAWEPRGPWPEEAVRGLCRKLDLVHCVDPLAARPLWGELCYFRLHGLGGYSYRYTDEDLRRLRATIPADKDCYLMFNNTNMEEDARRFRRLLGLPEA
jgi:uncharacterized protein YecE (DUF72 family)